MRKIDVDLSIPHLALSLWEEYRSKFLLQCIYVLPKLCLGNKV